MRGLDVVGYMVVNGEMYNVVVHKCNFEMVMMARSRERKV
jgi:hypothetical protein